MKTIDVMVGDGWTSKPGHAWLFQYRRGINFHVVGERDHWVPSEVHRHTEEQDIPGHLAEELLKAWGYHLTPVEGEKCQPKATSPVLTAEASGNARLVKETPPDFPTANSGKAELPKPAPQENKNDEKSCFRDVVPVVDAQARANAAHAHERLHEAWKRITALESRLAAVAAAPKPAAMVVKAPKPPVYGDGDWLAGVQWEAKRWVSELTSQGFTVADDNSTQH
jgi:hypothetical protein